MAGWKFGNKQKEKKEEEDEDVEYVEEEVEVDSNGDEVEYVEEEVEVTDDEDENKEESATATDNTANPSASGNSTGEDDSNIAEVRLAPICDDVDTGADTGGKGKRVSFEGEWDWRCVLTTQRSRT